MNSEEQPRTERNDGIRHSMSSDFSCMNEKLVVIDGMQQIAAGFPKPRSMTGFLAIFDVLGFKSFCQNNNDQHAAQEVLATIDLIPEYMPAMLLGAFQATADPAKG